MKHKNRKKRTGREERGREKKKCTLSRKPTTVELLFAMTGITTLSQRENRRDQPRLTSCQKKGPGTFWGERGKEKKEGAEKKRTPTKVKIPRRI